MEGYMQNKKFDVLVVGELNIDLVLWNVPMPENEKEKLAEDMRFAMGSSSAITAHNLAAVGAKVGFIGKAGNDNFGHYMIGQLEEGGVDTSHIIVDDLVKTGATIVLANPPKKALLTYMGAMTALTIDDIDWEIVQQARHLHLGCFFLQTGIRKDVWKLFAEAKKYGLTTSMDTNWDPEEKWGEDLRQALKYTDIFLPNDDEALRISQTDSVEKALDELNKTIKIVAIKQGHKGALLKTDDQVYTQGIYKVEAIETTGAGDSFNAGFLKKYLDGADWQECLKFGNACGALAVTAIGGTGAFKERQLVISKLTEIQNNG